MKSACGTTNSKSSVAYSNGSDDTNRRKVHSIMQGRRRGVVVPETVLDRLERMLLRNGVVLVRNADQILAGRSASGIFRVYKDGSATMFLRSRPTRYEVLHELNHRSHLKLIGPKAYCSLTRLEREQYVYDALRRSNSWWTFKQAETRHAADCIRRLGGTAW